MRRSAQLPLFAAPARRRGRTRGRPPGARPSTPHRARPEHAFRHPVHVTLRAVRGLPSFRSQRLHKLLRAIVAAPKYERFQVVHYSIQHDHLHLLLEAPDKRTLSSGVRSLVIRLAKRLNRLLGRSGKIWGDRYHRTDLGSPRQVRNALVYVLANIKKHAEIPAGVGVADAYSTAPTFDGWAAPFPLPWIPPPAPPPRAQTWLLREGWQRHGRIGFGEAPSRADHGTAEG